MSLSIKKKPGLYRKYSVRRLKDKTRKHEYCEYFVLDWSHDKFAPVAALAYASACESEFPELAADLRIRASRAALTASAALAATDQPKEKP